MARLKEKREDATVDMTPMIDCVFLLMVFFVLVIDLSQQDLEDLILPQAVAVVPDDNPPKTRPIVNIRQDGSLLYRGNVHYSPELHGEDYRQNGEDYRQMHSVLDAWQDDPGMDLHIEPCAEHERLAFWKVELAMSERDRELQALARSRAKK